MTRIALGVEYDGSGYSGWQRQHHAETVQARLEQALSAVACHPVVTMAAGRTDTGVHACEQVVHFDTHAERPDRAWVRGVNAHLPADIGVRWVVQSVNGFDARRSAESRRYRYLLVDRPTQPVLLRNRVGWTWRSLALEPMQQAAMALLGEHDFSSFRAAACQSRHPHRRVDALDVERRDGVIVFDIRANAFLHHMVRNIVGTLMRVGAGDYPPEWVEQVLAARDRRRAGVTAPATGLYLVAVDYPARFGLPVPPDGPVFALARGDG